MGYTHYWMRPQHFEPVTFRQYVLDVQHLLAHLPEHSRSAGEWHADDPLTIHGGSGHGEPNITASLVSFNGNADLDLDHETFHMPRDFKPQQWQRASYANGRKGGRFYGDFCKTARKPYDLVVCVALILLAYYFPEVTVSSDGVYSDWKEAVRLYGNLFDRPLPKTSGPWHEDADWYKEMFIDDTTD